jgi:hypothetical protein
MADECLTETYWQIVGPGLGWSELTGKPKKRRFLLTRLMLDREAAAQPQPPKQNEGVVVSSANASWRIKYRGRIALVIQLRLAFDRGRITQQEMLQTRSSISAVDDRVAAGAAKSFRRGGDYHELKATLDQNQEVSTQEGAFEPERLCNAEAFGFFVRCMYAGGSASDCDRQSFAYWCGLHGRHSLGK